MRVLILGVGPQALIAAENCFFDLSGLARATFIRPLNNLGWPIFGRAVSCRRSEERDVRLFSQSGCAANAASIKRSKKGINGYPAAPEPPSKAGQLTILVTFQNIGGTVDKIAAASGRRQADYAWTVLARVLSWSLNRGLIGVNPCERGGRLYRGGGRAEKIWTAADEAAFLERAPAHLHLPLLLALWTGQRQGDLLRLPWSAYDGKHIRLRQSKTGVRLFISITCLSVVVRQLYGDQKRSPAVTIPCTISLVGSRNRQSSCRGESH